MNKLVYALPFLLFINTKLLVAQNIKDETIDYSYVKLPLAPLGLSVKNYQASVTAAYEAENNKRRAAYETAKQQAEAEYKKEKELYPSKVKDAEERYNKALEEWNKKSLGNKVIAKEVLGENKPVKEIPPPPQLPYTQEPELKTSYDYALLASTYLKLDGFENIAGNAVKIEVTLYGYDYTEPREMTVQKNVTRRSDGQTQTVQQTYYYTEFSYRHPMAVKVTGADEKVIINITPQELNTHTIYKSNESATPPKYNRALMIKTYEEKILQQNLTFINNLVNDQIGFQHTKRSAPLYYVKSKDETYQDLLVAFNDASSGLKILIDDAASAKTKLKNAIQIWDKALQEADPKNKKARIDEKVMVPVCFNLLESHFALGKADDADKIFSLLGPVSLSNNERKQKADYETLFQDLKRRIQSNKNPK
jgi:hypothetical protein